MPEALARLQQQALEIWNDMDKSQKTRMIIIAILVIASITVAVYIVTRPNYENLFSGRLDSKEVGEMSTILKENNIEHKLTDGGTSLEVKSKDKDMAQIALAQAGYPRGGTTFKDALSSIKLSTTESDKKKIFKEYDEQKIAGGLKKIDNIKDAVVNLSLPEKDVFLGDPKAQMPTAAVMIEAREDLSKKQVDGIVRFVAASVEGLEPKNVKVIDKYTGRLLNSANDDDTTGITSSQYEIIDINKKDIESKVTNLFSNRYDGLRVAANVVCDFSTETTKEVQYTPVVGGDSGILRSSETHKEEVQNGSTGGVPGTDSNGGDTTTPSYPTGDGTSSSYKKTDVINNFEINQKNIERNKAIGMLDTEKSSITVSFLYGINTPNAPAQPEIDEALNAISKATGIPEKNIAITSFKLNPTKVETPKTDWMSLLGKIGPIAIVGILILLLAIGVMRRGTVLDRGLAIEGPRMNTSLSTSTASEENLPEIEIEEKSEVKKQIDKFIKHKPEAVAQLLRNWLADDWD